MKIEENPQAGAWGLTIRRTMRRAGAGQNLATDGTDFKQRLTQILILRFALKVANY